MSDPDSSASSTTVADEVASKSKRKRDHKQMQQVVAKLIDLPAKHLERLELDEAQREQIAIGRGAKRAARQRQVRYLSRYLEPELLLAAADLIAELDGEERRRSRFARSNPPC